MPRSKVVKHSVVIGGHKTSISLEDDFWQHLKRAAKTEGLTISEFIATYIDTPERENTNLSSAIRLYFFNALQNGGVHAVR